MTNGHQSYVKLLTLIPSIQDTDLAEAIALSGPENLTAEVVQRHHKKIVVRLSRQIKGPSDAMVADTECTIAMYTEAQTSEVLTYRDRFDYRKVYSDDMMAVSPSTKVELNSFLAQWLTKLLMQANMRAE